jgi:CO/xanthine dehydrogenase Mo-binding subunit
MDYLCPTVREMPELRIHHLDGDTGFVPSRAKGIGEGNCMAAPAAIANAVTDALSAHGVEVTELPVHGARIWEWLQARQRPEEDT